MCGEKGFKLGHKAWHALSGLFAVYKPAGLSPNKVKHIIKTTLLEGEKFLRFTDLINFYYVKHIRYILMSKAI